MKRDILEQIADILRKSGPLLSAALINTLALAHEEITTARDRYATVVKQREILADETRRQRQMIAKLEGEIAELRARVQKARSVLD